MAFLDVKLTLTLSEEDTLYPALDSISHALESLWNNRCTPISRAFALQALALLNNSLPLVTKDPKIEFPLYFPFYLDWQLTGTEEQVVTVNKKNTELTSFRLKLPRLSDYLKSNWAKYYQ